ncbi:MAG: hypothetical protein HYU66_01425 [Armatimonadetes bacterium]|nr:hypothetical protein [Armatimonadota bacterium]
MSRYPAGSHEHPFPPVRPAVCIEPISDGPREVDWCELWSVVPVLGDLNMWAFYDHPNWNLTGVCRQEVVGECSVHGVEGVEIDVDDYEPKQGWGVQPGTMWGRLTPTSRQWLASLWTREGGGVRRLRTFLDPGFDATWGEWPRRVADDGWLVRQPDGSYRQAVPEGTKPYYTTGCATFRVTIGGRSFDCLRLVGVEDQPRSTAKDVLTEMYVPADGRHVYCCNRRSDTAEQYPDDVFVLDGVAYGPWYDCVTAQAL